MDQRRLISANAQSLRELHSRVHDVWRAGRGSTSHVAACEQFRTKYDTLAFPGGLTGVWDRLKQSDPATIETAVQFLEEDPWFFRSGYIKEKLVRRLKQAPLTPSQRERLRPVILRGISSGPRRVFNQCAKLAPLTPVSGLLPGLERYAASTNPEMRRRTQHVLHVLKSRGRIG